MAEFHTIWDKISIHNRRLLHVVVLMIVGSAVYSNSFTVPFILDDFYGIEYLGKQNLLEHILHGSARRVADITFALNYRLHGLNVAGYHLTNLALHLATAILVYLISISALSALRMSFASEETTAVDTHFIDQYLPLAIALLFVVHPIQTQAVTYIIQRYTSLATFFYLLSTLFFIRTRLAIERHGMCWNSWALAGMTLSAGILAVGSKQIAVTLPFMLFFLELFLFRGRLINRRFFIACGAIFIITVTLVLIKWSGSTLNDFLFDLRHATSEDLFFPRTAYFLTQTRVVVTYLSLLCLPIGQNLVHDAPIYSSLSLVPAVSLALHISLVVLAIVLFKKSRQNFLTHDWSRGALQRLASLGIFWFYIAMAVESSFIPIRDVIFEHRIYLPSVGFFMTVTAGAALAAQGSRRGRNAAWAILAVICLLLGGMTIARNNVWNDPLTLWQDSARKSPNKWLAVANLAGEYLDRNMPDKSVPLYVRAIELNPNIFIRTKVGLGDALKALKIYESRFTTGEEYILPGGLLGSGELDYKNLAKWEGVTHNTMGLAYEYLNKPQQAKIAYHIALRMNPAYDLAWYNLALLSIRLGDQRQAQEALRQLQIFNPTLARTIDSKLITGMTGK